jgi:hypothetical protein
VAPAWARAGPAAGLRPGAAAMAARTGRGCRSGPRRRREAATIAAAAVAAAAAAAAAAAEASARNPGRAGAQPGGNQSWSARSPATRPRPRLPLAAGGWAGPQRDPAVRTNRRGGATAAEPCRYRHPTPPDRPPGWSSRAPTGRRAGQPATRSVRRCASRRSARSRPGSVATQTHHPDPDPCPRMLSRPFGVGTGGFV